MSEEGDPGKELQAIAKILDSEAIKLLRDVYHDGLSKPLRALGDTGDDLIRFIASTPERLRQYWERAKERVPEERRIEAVPARVLPILSDLRFMEEGDPLTELYLNLLARAIDQEGVDEAHPAFVRIIGQLSPDEAFILYKLRNGSMLETASTSPFEDLAYPQHFLMYVSHLESLSLVSTGAIPNLEMNSPDGSDALLSQIQVTGFGKLFIKACIPDNFDISTSTAGS